MDVTNPGLINVADQVAGNPSTAPSGGSLSVPHQDDVLQPVADEGHPEGEQVSPSLDAASTTFPTPVTVQAGDESPSVSSKVQSVVPGTAPEYAPAPQVNLADTVAGQSLTGVNVTEVVVGPNSNIQVNQNSESERNYAVTSVLDADTGGPVVDPAVPVTGTFNAVFDGGGGTLLILSPSDFPPVIIDGDVVSVASTSGAAINTNAAISSVSSQSGTISAVNDAGGGKVTVSSPTLLPAGLLSGQPVTLATGWLNYDGPRATSGATNMSGPFTKVATASGGTKVEVIGPTIVPTPIVPGKFVTLTGGVYNGTFKVDSLGTAQGGNFDSAADNGLSGTTFHSPTPLPVELVAGQVVTLAGSVYTNSYAVSAVNVLAQTFDLAVAFTTTDAGTWSQVDNYAFVLDVAFSTIDSGSWTCFTFDVVATYTGLPATGTWSSYTFKIPGTYSATAAGVWAFTPVTNFTTRYRLGVSPADLTSFGISLLGREIVFDDDTVTAADQGASRLVSYYGAGYVVVNRSDPDDDSVPVMSQPTAGPPQADTFTLYVQREGSEVFVDSSGAAADVVISPPPPAFVPNAPAGQASLGNVDVTTGPQPGAPVTTSGTLVPTARTVNVADQATSVGLPKNVFV